MALVFNFDEMGGKGDKVIAEVIRLFKKEGVLIVKELTNISQIKRSSGISFREITLVSTDSQKVVFAIKQSGDIYKVKFANEKGIFKEIPIKNQQDHTLAIKEIADKLEASRKRFQALLAKTQKNDLAPELKSKMKTTTRQTEKSLQEEIRAIDEALAEADKRLGELEKELFSPKPNPTGADNVPVGAFGKIFHQFKYDAQGAIQQLMKEQGGEAIAALYHPEIGDIDLVWGEEGDPNKSYEGGYGLAKIIRKHPEVLSNLQGILNQMNVNLARSGSNRLRMQSEDGRYRAVVRLTWEGKEKKWLLTAFEKGRY